MLAIPRDAPPRQLAGITGIFLLEWPFNTPIMRQVQQAPLAIVEVRLRVGNGSSWFRVGTDGGSVGAKRVAGRQNPGSQRGIFKIGAGIR